MNPKISADHLKRRAIVYIRQSSPGQVIHNQESQRRQYGLADHARQLGFQQVEIIDEDLGRSGSGQVERVRDMKVEATASFFFCALYPSVCNTLG
jgi:hypothetical protein